MGLLLVLALVVLLCGPVALVVVLRLQGEVAALRRRLESGATPASAVATAASQSPPAVRAPATPGARTAARRDLEAAFGAAWLTWVGILAIFFGTACFLATDLGASRFAGAGQVLAGAVVGLLFVLAGRFAAPRRQRFLGLGLLGGGVALLDLTAFGAHAFHRLVPGAVVFPFLLAVAILGAVLALREHSRTIAGLTLAGALATPLFLRLPADPARALFPYLAMVVLGVAIVATRRAWHALPLLAFAGTVLVVATWWSRDFDRDGRAVALAGTAGLWLLFAWQGLYAGSASRSVGAARSVVAIANAACFAWALHRLLAPDLEFLRGLAIGALALAYVGGAHVAARRGARAGAALVTEYAGVALAAAAIPVQFDLGWIAFGWAALALVLVQAGVMLPSRAHRVLGIALLALAGMRIVSVDTVAMLRDVEAARPFWNAPFVTGACVAAAAAIAARFLHRRRTVLGLLEARSIDALAVAGAGLLLWWISVEVFAAFAAIDAARATPNAHGRTALVTLSLVWAVYAGLAIAAGFAARYRPLRFFGMAVLGLLVTKVFVFDLQALERGHRVASFVGVGILLLAVSVLYQRERRA